MNVALTEFCNVDGQLGKTVFPFPHKPFTEAENYARWDQVSAAERFDQIKDRLTPDQQSLLLSIIVTASGAPANRVACTEILRWWALAGYNSQAYMDYIIKWKLKCGQTGLALRIFRDALASGNLSYRFSSPVQQIHQSRQQVIVTTKDNQRIFAQYLVCTVPLNTLNDITFDPPLSHSKALAASKGQINLCVKAHAEVEGRDHRCWWGLAYSNKPGIMAGAFGDGLTPSGNAHLVSFSVNDAFTGGSDHGFAQIKAAYEEFHPFKIKRLVSSKSIYLSPLPNWHSHPFQINSQTHSSTTRGRPTPTQRAHGRCTRQASAAASSATCKLHRAASTSPAPIGPTPGMASSTARWSKGCVPPRRLSRS